MAIRSHLRRCCFSIALTALLICQAAVGLAFSPAPGTAITNTVSVRYADAHGNPLPAASGTATVALSGAGLLHLQIIANSNPVAAGAVHSYTFQYENSGNAGATGIQIVDTLPANVTFQSASGGGVYNAVDRSVTWTVNNLASGSGGSLTLAVKVADGLAVGTKIINAATMTAAEGIQDKVILTTTVGTAANLVITTAVTSTVTMPNGVVSYTLSYRNIGNVDARQVRITDQIPSGTAYLPGSATSPGILTGNVLTWDLGDLAAGSQGILQFQVRVSPLALVGQKINNTATIISTDQTKSSNMVVVDVSDQAIFQLKETAPESVRPGQAITYVIQVVNTGAIPLTGMMLKDLLPIGTTFVSADSGGVAAAGSRQVNWNIGTLAAGKSQTVTLTVNVNLNLAEGQIIENIANATSNETAPQTVKAISSVIARTQGVVGFFDATWQPVYGYMHGDAVYLQVTDLDQNIDPSVADTITVVLKDLKADAAKTITLMETGPNTGIFRSVGISTSLNATPTGDGNLTVTANNRIQATYTDPLDISPASTALAMIDPLGIVFDSVTGAPVAGTVVTLRNWTTVDNTCDFTSLPVLPPGQINPALPTGADGKFAFPLVTAADYCYQVTPSPGYVFPSAVPDADLPAGFTIGNGSRGEKFTLSVGDPPLIRDIPVDPPAGTLSITKTANKAMAAIGDIVAYSLKLTNKDGSPVKRIVVTDIMPHGIEYLPGSSQLDGKSLPDPGTKGNLTLAWTVPDLAPNKSLEITYRAVVGPDGPRGDGVNTVFASGSSLGRSIGSNTAKVKVKISGGVFSEKGTIIGKIFHDRDGNRIQNKFESSMDGKETDEPGIPNVAIYLDDGTRVITDSNGKFSLLGIMPGTHVLRVDETTLPKGMALVPLSNRFLGDGVSQFVDMPPSGLSQADFAVARSAGGSAVAQAPASTYPKSPTQAGSSGTAPSISLKHGGRDWEMEIKTMSPDFDFLSPADGSVLISDRIRVVLKSPFGTKPSLSLNGIPVDTKQIGRKIDYEQGQVTVFEYIDIHLNDGEANVLKAEIHDPFGIVRGAKEITVKAAGAPEKILLQTDKAQAPADGSSVIRVDVSLRDKNDIIVPYAAIATVSVSAGEIVEKDVDPNQENFQILIKEGVGQFTVRAPRETGQSIIVVGLDNRQESAKVFFTPHLRSLFLVGTGEVTIGHGQGQGNYGFLKDNLWFDDGLYSGASGAFFLKGNVYKDFLLTAAYDSKKKKSDELFRSNDTALDGEDKYPIYGDESKTGYEAVSADKLYLKLEKNRSYLLYGDYKTDLNDTRLAAYNRSFNGLKYELSTDSLKVRSFGSYTDQTQVMDILPGKGISGYYYLTRQSVMDGSERVAIETRDRYRPDSVLHRESKVRGSDYEVDYDTGALLFKEPIPSHDSDYNPIYIVASYESKTFGEKYYIYGGRGAFKPYSWLELGATGVIEEKALGEARLSGLDVTLTLPRKTIVKAEYAETKSIFEETSIFNWRSGDAWSLNIKSEPTDKLRLNGYYRTLDNYFQNLSTVDASRGTTKYGFDADYELLPETRLQGRFFDERDDLNDMVHRLGSIGLQTKFQKTKITAALSNESSSDHYIPLTNPNNRSPFDITQETPHKLTDIKVGIETELRPDLSLTLSHKQNLSQENYQLSQAGLNYQLSSQNRLYLREEHQKYQEREETRTLVGVETQLIKNTVAYNEYRLADGADGARNQNVLGLRNKFFIGENITGNVAGEYLKTLSGVQRSEEPDAVAGSLGLEYLPTDQAKFTGRLERRRELISQGKSSYLGEVGMAYKLHPDYSLLMRERHFTEDMGTGGTHTSSRTMIGLAYRPLLTNQFNALSKIEYKQESNTVSTPALNQDAWIFSGEGVWQATPRLQVTGKYAGKLVTDAGFTSYTDLTAVRLIYDLTDQWDVGGEYRILTSHATHSSYQGGALEIGYRVIKNLWVSAGYSFDKFDADLSGDAYQGKGPYLKLRIKFDENIFSGSK